MIDIVLLEPEIPNNTGAIARTCACTGARLHLIKPLGFDISDAAVKRAGLDYWPLVDISVYECIDEYFERSGDENIWLTTTKAKGAAASRRSSVRCARCSAPRAGPVKVSPACRSISSAGRGARSRASISN